MKQLVIQLDQSVPVMKTLASHRRVQILELLCNQELSISEIAERLDISQPAATIHIQKLEEVGLVKSELCQYNGSVHKRCVRIYDEIVLHLPTPEFHKGDSYYEVEMPIGLFSNFEVAGTCGLVSDTEPVGHADDPNSFLTPKRVFAQLLWFSQGFVEYNFPNNLPQHCEPTCLELTMEICSEAFQHKEDYPSDISFWVNGIDLGKWTSPGDFGGKPGKYSPSWWYIESTQFGLLKKLRIDETGTFMDEEKISDITIQQLDIQPNTMSSNNPVVVRLGVKGDAENVGGLNLFGEHFGNYAQNLHMRVQYREKQKNA